MRSTEVVLGNLSAVAECSGLEPDERAMVTDARAHIAELEARIAELAAPPFNGPGAAALTAADMYPTWRDAIVALEAEKEAHIESAGRLHRRIAELEEERDQLKLDLERWRADLGDDASEARAERDAAREEVARGQRTLQEQWKHTRAALAKLAEVRARAERERDNDWGGEHGQGREIVGEAVLDILDGDDATELRVEDTTAVRENVLVAICDQLLTEVRRDMSGRDRMSVTNDGPRWEVTVALTQWSASTRVERIEPATTEEP